MYQVRPPRLRLLVRQRAYLPYISPHLPYISPTSPCISRISRQELTALLRHCAADAAARGGSANGAGAPAPQSLLLPCLELLVSLAPLGLVSLGELGAPGLLEP